MASINTQINLTDGMSASLRNITSALNTMGSAFNSVEGNMSRGLDVGNVEEVHSELESASKAADQLGEEQDQFNDKVEEGANLAGGLATKIASMVAAIGIGKLASDAIEYASDLGEVENVTNTVFGESSQAKVEEWAKSCLDAYGLNELSAKRYVGTMGAMLESSGIAGDQLLDMSESMVTLAGDMASFYNLDAETAFNKIRSGISGETEPLKQLGINMSVANLEAYALAQGLETEYSKMSQAEQVQVRYNYLMEKTAKVQGDFTKTSDSFANQQKLLTENFNAMTGELASKFIPILEDVFAMLNSGVKFLQENLDVVLPILSAVVAVVGAYAAVNMLLGAANAFAAVKQWALNSAVLACPIFWIMIAIIALIGLIYALGNTLAKETGETFSLFGTVAGVVYSLYVFIYNIVADFVNFFANVWADPIGSIARLFAGLADTVLGFLELIARGIDAVFGSNLAAAVQGWRDGLDTAVTDTFGEGTVVLEKKEMSTAFDVGYNWGAEKEGLVTDALANIESITATSSDTATSAASAAKSLDSTKEDLKYLRDIAEREVINRFTTAEVKVDFGGITNNVSSGFDLDGVIDYIASGVEEALEITAEGVHE